MKYIAYVDGSYKEYAGQKYYASAAIIAPEGTTDWTQMTKVSCDADLISMRNVAGEIMAVMLVMEHCLNSLQLGRNDEVILNYDYAGIENWVAPVNAKNHWRCKNCVTQAYRNYMINVVGPRFKVRFNHTPGHTGIAGNEIVDKLAKRALEDKFQELTSK